MAEFVWKHAARANGWRYWLALSRNTVRYYARMHRWRALARAFWRVAVRGYYGEICEVCARRYVLWYAPETIWQVAVPGSRGVGLLCPACFSEAADERGLIVEWCPLRFPVDREAINVYVGGQLTT